MIVFHTHFPRSAPRHGMPKTDLAFECVRAPTPKCHHCKPDIAPVLTLAHDSKHPHITTKLAETSIKLQSTRRGHLINKTQGHLVNSPKQKCGYLTNTQGHIHTHIHTSDDVRIRVGECRDMNMRDTCMRASLYLSIYLFIYLSIYLSIYLYIHRLAMLLRSTQKPTPDRAHLQGAQDLSPSAEGPREGRGSPKEGGGKRKDSCYHAGPTLILTASFLHQD